MLIFPRTPAARRFRIPCGNRTRLSSVFLETWKNFRAGTGGGLRNSMKRKRKRPPLFLLLSIELRRGLFPSGNLQRVQLCGFVPALGAPPQRLLAKPTPTAPPLRHLANLASEVVRYAVISNRDGPARNAAVRTKCGNEATCFSLHCIATRETASAQLKRRCNAAVRVVHCYCLWGASKWLMSGCIQNDLRLRQK